MNEKAPQSKQDWKCAHRRSFLLRLWCAGGPGGSNWQASLESPENGERIGFASLEELFAYLMDLAAAGEQHGPKKPHIGKESFS